MDIEDLKLIEHLAHSLHFNNTAEAFFMSPSNLTRRIQNIEEELGTALFERDKRNVTLSPEGIKALKFAENTLENLDSLKDQLHDPKAVLTGNIHIFCSVTASYGVLPKLLKKFRKSHPEVTIKLETGAVQNVSKKLLNKEADVGIMPIPEQLPTEMIAKEISTIPLVWIHKKNNKNRIDWENDSIILPEKGSSRTLINNWFEHYDINPKKTQSLQEFESILSLVSAGYGVGLVPRIVWEQSLLAKKTEVIRSPHPLPKLNVGLISTEKKCKLKRIAALYASI